MMSPNPANAWLGLPYLSSPVSKTIAQTPTMLPALTTAGELFIWSFSIFGESSVLTDLSVEKLRSVIYKKDLI